MKTVVFHLQAKTCEKDISKLKEEILSYNIRIEEKELSEVKEEKDGILAITDQFSDVDYAKEHNIAVIFYETPGTNRSPVNIPKVRHELRLTFLLMSPDCIPVIKCSNVRHILIS